MLISLPIAVRVVTHDRPLPWRQGIAFFPTNPSDYAQQVSLASSVKTMHFNQNTRQALSEVPSTA